MTPEQFAELDRRHPEVWQLFERFAFERMALGFEHYSADAILHRIRWETDAATGEAPKINNNASAHYARKFREAHPERARFFRTRRSAADRRAAEGRVRALVAEVRSAAP